MIMPRSVPAGLLLQSSYFPQSFANAMLTLKLGFLGGPGNVYDLRCPESWCNLSLLSRFWMRVRYQAAFRRAAPLLARLERLGQGLRHPFVDVFRFHVCPSRRYPNYEHIMLLFGERRSLSPALCRDVAAHTVTGLAKSFILLTDDTLARFSDCQLNRKSGFHVSHALSLASH
jgi:hypothetical protein